MNDRRPFLIHHDTVAKIDILEPVSRDFLNMYWSCWEEDEDIDTEDEVQAIWKNGAKEFVRQLEGRWCVAFFRCLRDELDRIIKEHEEQVRQRKKKAENGPTSGEGGERCTS